MSASPGLQEALAGGLAEKPAFHLQESEGEAAPLP